MQTCPCGNRQTYRLCCGRFIEQHQNPSTPEELMRSRYTAYTKANIKYIQKTMISPASDHFNPKEAKKWAKKIKWLKLEVISSEVQGQKAWVEFIATFSENGKNQTLHERSEFHQMKERWFYVDGSHLD